MTKVRFEVIATYRHKYTVDVSEEDAGAFEENPTSNPEFFDQDDANFSSELVDYKVRRKQIRTEVKHGI